MTGAIWLSFVGTVMVLGLLPGPNVALIVANSLTYGLRAGVLTVCATLTSIVIQLVLVMAGLAAVLLMAGGWLSLIRWAGVIYLLVIGVMQWRAGPLPLETVKAVPVKRIMVQAAAVSLGNPKTLLFDIALFSQFIRPDSAALPQIILLGTTMTVVLFAVDCGWALSAAKARPVLARFGRLASRVSGGLMMGAGVGLGVAAWRAARVTVSVLPR